LFLLFACHSTEDGGATNDRDAADTELLDRAAEPDPDMIVDRDRSNDAAIDTAIDVTQDDPDAEPEVLDDPDIAVETTPIDVAEEVGVCERWNADRGSRSEGSWSGSAAECDPGTVSDEGLDNALRQVNLYRWLADLPPVSHASEFNERAQSCALLMHANNSLSHNPPDTWTCYNETAAQAAGASSLSMAPGVVSVDHYMVDRGNPTTLGHRRWILSDWLAALGLGSTSRASCMYFDSVFGGSGGWTAWPAPGVFPIQAASDEWATLDDTGWSIQSDNIDLGSAEVTIETEGTELSVTVETLLQNYGSSSAISIIPNGWRMQADTTYSVTVSGLSTEIAYQVSVVDCSR